MTDVNAWQLADCGLLLHPPFWLPRRDWVPVVAALAPGISAAGEGWWHLAISADAALASRLPSREVTATRASPRAPVVAPGRRDFQLRGADPVPVAAVHEAPLSHAQASRFLSSQRVADADSLSRQYWHNAAVRDAVGAALRHAQHGTVEDAVALGVAARASDPALWEAAAEKAARGSPSAAGALSEWRDSRGAGLFSPLLSGVAGPMAGLSVSHALKFFIRWADDQGLSHIVGEVGEPINSGSNSVAHRLARVTLGYALNSLDEAGNFTPRPAWLEYVATCLLMERLTEADSLRVSRGLQLLTRHADPRAPIVAWRLVRAGVYDEEDIPGAIALAVDGDRQAISGDLLPYIDARMATAEEEEQGALERIRDHLRRGSPLFLRRALGDVAPAPAPSEPAAPAERQAVKRRTAHVPAWSG